MLLFPVLPLTWNWLKLDGGASRSPIDEIHVPQVELVMPFIAEVANLTYKAVRQFALDREIPALVVSILGVSINCLRTETLVLQVGQEWSDRVGEVGHIGGRKRVAGCCT